jgi:outer membrane protein assembly factor BamE (lipoprotein component of BamABCDE complex)
MRSIHRLLLAGAAVLALSACAAVENQRGYVPDQTALQSVAVGTDTKTTVAQKLGNPSVAGTFTNNTWYYVSSHDVQTAFFAPHPVERNIVAVEFNDAGQVAAIKRYGMADGRVVDYASRETPTRGRDLSILQQIFNAVPGNIGQQAQPIDQNPGGGTQPPP